MITDQVAASALQKFDELVGIRFQLYNSLFTALPFHRIEKTGVLLSLFLIHCEEGYSRHKSPEEIIDSFMQQYTGYTDTRDQLDLLFRFVQYAERQVVLFDALEDAAFTRLNDASRMDVLQQLRSPEVKSGHDVAALVDSLRVRLVLTAHPTQFYPGEVLAIIHDLSQAIIANDTVQVNAYLRQLGKTSFMKKEKPSPYEEAVNMMWFLQHVFYPAAGNIMRSVYDSFPQKAPEGAALIRMGFWPGGDRDGNPFVKADGTLRVAQALRERLLRLYYHDIRQIRRRLTFKGISEKVIAVERKIFEALFEHRPEALPDAKTLAGWLLEIRSELVEAHNALFLDLVDDMLAKVHLFGLFFATLDIRQDSTVHTALLESIAGTLLPADYTDLPDEEKIKVLAQQQPAADLSLEDEVRQDVPDAMRAMKKIQEQNGEEGCNRYIISHCTSALNVMEVYGLLLLSGWQKDNMTVDIVPLFETIQDLQMAAGIMESLYQQGTYQEHLQRRGNRQTIMLGFSDGTKDGGYLMANWAIYKAKESLTAVSKQYGIEVIFFDGRGGPPARGGGKTQKFYASMGNNIAGNEIQLTIQGQTVSANFGTIDTAQYNIDQLLQAGIHNKLYAAEKPTLAKEEDQLLQVLAEESFTAYTRLKEDPLFLEYLSEVSPLRYYAHTNIGSRPAKRNQNGKLTLNDLRAIPFVGSWSQLKQNVSGFYGVGAALQAMEQKGSWEQVKALYQQSAFFKALLDNCEMALRKCYFPLTAHLAKHEKFGALWNNIHDEYQLTCNMLLKLSGKQYLMENEPVSSQSIQMRERIVLPLVTIQQYGLIRINGKDSKDDDGLEAVLGKLITRCSFGIINAGRNSA